jgi:hypothetical protein
MWGVEAPASISSMRVGTRDYLDMRCGPCPSRVGPCSIFQLLCSRCSTIAPAILCCSSSVTDRAYHERGGAPSGGPLPRSSGVLRPFPTSSAIKTVLPEHSPKNAAGEAALYLAGGKLFFQAINDTLPRRALRSLRSHRLRRLKPLTPTLSPAVHSAILPMLHCCTSVETAKHYLLGKPG